MARKKRSYMYWELSQGPDLRTSRKHRAGRRALISRCASFWAKTELLSFLCIAKTLLLYVFDKMNQANQDPLLIRLMSTAAPCANPVPTTWGHAASSLPTLCVGVNVFRGDNPQASSLDARQLKKCHTPG